MVDPCPRRAPRQKPYRRLPAVAGHRHHLIRYPSLLEPVGLAVPLPFVSFVDDRSYPPCPPRTSVLLSPRRGTDPATQNSLPPRWGKVRACPVLVTGMGVKIRRWAPPAEMSHFCHILRLSFPNPCSQAPPAGARRQASQLCSGAEWCRMEHISGISLHWTPENPSPRALSVPPTGLPQARLTPHRIIDRARSRWLS